MKTVSIRDLHERTGHWVRRAARQRIVITDRGQKTAVLVPYSEAEPVRRTLRDRKTLSGFAALKPPATKLPDVTALISEDRNRS